MVDTALASSGPVSAMMDSMNSVMNKVGGRVELKRKTRDGLLVPTDARDLAEADSNARLGQVTELVSRMNPTESLEWAVNKRQEGNKLFDQGNFEAAMQSYLESLVGAETAIHGMPGDNPATVEAKTAALCNMAACALQLKQYHKAFLLCDQVIMFNKSSFRAFCRRGVAHIHLEEFDKARADLNEALKLASDDSERQQVQANVQRLNEAIRRDRQATKEQGEFYRKALEGIKNSQSRLYDDEPAMKKLVSRMSGLERSLSWDDEPKMSSSSFDREWLIDMGLLTLSNTLYYTSIAFHVLTLGLVR